MLLRCERCLPNQVVRLVSQEIVRRLRMRRASESLHGAMDGCAQ